MTEIPKSKSRCVHCLRLTDSITDDHVFPSSWYPDTTPPTVQRWTVPCCLKCNQELGKLEKDLLIRLALCVDPSLEAASGLAARTLRSLGLDTNGLTQKEKGHRDTLRAKIRAELIPHAEVVGLPGKIPSSGFPEKQSESDELVIPIPWAGLSIISEKIARGCEFRLMERFVEPPYGIRTFFLQDPKIVPPFFKKFGKHLDIGPGCQVMRVFAKEDSKVVQYMLSIWDTYSFHVHINLESELNKFESMSSKAQGITPSQGKMPISPYLRRMK